MRFARSPNVSEGVFSKNLPFASIVPKDSVETGAGTPRTQIGISRGAGVREAEGKFFSECVLIPPHRPLMERSARRGGRWVVRGRWG